MSFIEEYKKIIKDGYTKIICVYDKKLGNYEYMPFSHVNSNSWKDEFIDVLIKNLLNYCYEPNELESLYSPNFPDLENYIAKAIRDRLNKKSIQVQQDGLCGELLIDLILRMENEYNDILLCRPKYQQPGSRAELKNYDVLMFRKDNENVNLILGQVKTGKYDYCSKSMEKDLNTKYNNTYFGNAVCYIADKRLADNVCSVELSNILKDINVIALGTNDTVTRNTKICDYIKNNKIKVEIPCLLFYGKENIYADNDKLREKIDSELSIVKNYFDNKSFNICNFDNKICFYIFPAKSINDLRDCIMKNKLEVWNG